MHGKPQAESLPLDIELERTLRNMRKVKSVESTTMAERRERMQPLTEEAVAKRPQRQITMVDFWTLAI